MDVFEYLKTQSDLNLSTIAVKMWPNHKSAKTYLSVKLSGKRPFTKKDEQKAIAILNELGHKLLTLTTSSDQL